MVAVLFLDFDGPVVNARSQIAFPTCAVHRSFDPVAVALINRICDETNCRLVISTNWRLMANVTDIVRVAGFTGKFFGYDDLSPDDIWGISLGQRKHCTTPVVEKIEGQSSRGLEIKAWLDAHPEVTNYVIIDDLDVLPEQAVHHIKVDEKNGLMVEDFFAAKKILAS